jgi:ABC-type branched-subunit amino acid transport system substrate-binding protein
MRLRVAAIAVALVLLVGAGVGGWRAATYLESRCGGDDFRGVDGVQRAATGECVGVTDGQVIFSEDLRSVEQRIEMENNRVHGGGQAYVSIAYLTPMTLTASDADTPESLRHELEGAYTALYRENNTRGPGYTPQLRLLLANDGSGGAQWSVAVDDIEQRQKSSDHLVAVAGLGPSFDTTWLAIRSLSTAGIAMMGATMTANDLISPKDLARVSPTNTDEANALVNYTRGRSGVHTALIIQSTDSSDRYAQTLGTGFQEFQDHTHYSLVGQRIQQYEPERAASDFGQIMANICAAHPDVLFFAGRGRELPALLSALSSRPCPDTPINIITGDDASTMPVDEVVTTALGRGVTLTYATLAHPMEWDTPLAPSGQANNYRDFSDQYRKLFGTEPLDDGQAIMAYDAVLAVSTAVHHIARSNMTPGDVAGEWKLLNQSNSVPGASGLIGFKNDGTPENKAIPLVQLLQTGQVRFLQVSWPCGSPPPATCP